MSELRAASGPLRAYRVAALVVVATYGVAVVASLTPLGSDVYRNGSVHGPFVVALSLTAAVGAWAAWARLRLERTSSGLLLFLAFALLAVLYAPHALLRPTGNDPAHLLFGPLSRAAFGILLVAAASGIRLRPLERVSNVAVLTIAVGLAVTVDIAVHLGALSNAYAAEPVLFLRRVEAVALGLQLIALVSLLRSWWTSHRPFLLAVVGAVVALSVGSALFLSTTPWQGRWWVAHGGLFTGAVVLTLGIANEASRRGRLAAALDIGILSQLAENVVDAISDGLAIHDRDGTLIGWNRAAEKLTGWEHGTAMQRFSVDLPEGVFAVDDGKWIHLRRFELRHYGREYTVTLFSDATAQAALQQAYRQEQEARAQLAAVDQMKDTFMQAVAHDLRNPLAVMLGMAELLEKPEGSLAAENQGEVIRAIVANGRRLQKMLADLLDFERLSRGVVAPERRKIELSTVIHDVLASIDPSGHPIEIDLEETNALIDPLFAGRIVENLVTNALRHTPAGTTVCIRAHRAEEGIFLTVEDCGPGVPDPQKQTIFEEFRRGGSSAPGMGVGLALVSKFAQMHGGRAWVEDRPGGGATFRVVLAEQDHEHSPQIAAARPR